MDIERIFQQATAGRDEIAADWIPATALRFLQLDDPFCIWAKFWGAEHGFEKDPADYSFLEKVGTRGIEFEDGWIREMASPNKQIVTLDWQARKAFYFRRTLEALAADDCPVLHKVPVMWAPDRLYGAIDLCVKNTWLYKRFPACAPKHPEPEHWIVLDCKNITGLRESGKKKDLELATSQVQLYSYMLGKITGYTPRRAFLITRDHPFEPLAVEVNHTHDSPLDPTLAQLRDQYIDLKLNGHRYLPWRDLEQCGPNFSNDHDEPFHQAKKRVAKEFIPGGPLEWLPGVGKDAAAELRKRGYANLKEMLAHDPDSIAFDKIKGLSGEKLAKIRAVLHANKSGKASHVPAHLAVQPVDCPMFVDYEYFTSVNTRFDEEWPLLDGTAIIFAVGCGYEEDGAFKYRSFTSKKESFAAEGDMLEEFVEFLRERGIWKKNRTSALYHWTKAEKWQSEAAAERHQIDELASLPWVDLQKPFHQGPIAIPGAWGWGLKEIAKALGDYVPEYKVVWPEGLGAGLQAMVAGWVMYEADEPEKTPEYKILHEYLETDCKATWQIWRWLKASATAHKSVHAHQQAMGWYRGATREPVLRPAGWYSAGLLAPGQVAQNGGQPFDRR